MEKAEILLTFDRFIESLESILHGLDNVSECVSRDALVKFKLAVNANSQKKILREQPSALVEDHLIPAMDEADARLTLSANSKPSLEAWGSLICDVLFDMKIRRGNVESVEV